MPGRRLSRERTTSMAALAMDGLGGSCPGLPCPSWCSLKGAGSDSRFSARVWLRPEPTPCPACSVAPALPLSLCQAFHLSACSGWQVGVRSSVEDGC